MDDSLRAGVARVELLPPLGLAMMGYGARQGTASARHDPLYARALFLGSGDGAALLVEADLCLVGVTQAEAMRREIAQRTGLAREQILLGCIHTHSGPETGLVQSLLGQPDAPEVTALFDAVVRAAARAVEGAESARIGFGRAAVRIGRNRRVEAGPLDTHARVVRVDRAEAGEEIPIAVLYIHGCHPTVLGHDNLAYSADWPGAASRFLEGAFPGATPIFALGAHADVDPRTRGLLDLAIPDQSVGASVEEMESLGREVGEAVAAAARALQTSPRCAVSSAARRVPLAAHCCDRDETARVAWLGSRRAAALAALGLGPDDGASTADFYRLEGSLDPALSAEERRERLSRVRLYLRDRTARRIAGGPVPDVEVQVLRIGPLFLLGLPLEVTVDVGLDWCDRIGALHGAEAGELASIVSIANGWMRYLPHAKNFAEPLADQKYEILQSTFVPDAATALVDAAVSLAETLGRAASEERSER